MKQLLLSIFLITTCYNDAFSINSYSLGDRLVVWAKSGLNLREGPNIQSKVISKIVFGETVIAQEGKRQYESSNNITDKQTLANGKSYLVTLSGKWLKVKINDLEGYLFDAYLSTIKYEANTSMIGVLTNHKGICNKYLGPYDDGIRNILNDGTYIETWWHDGAGGSIIMIPYLSIEEAYIIHRALHRFGDIIEQNEKGEIIISDDYGSTQISTFRHFVVISQSGSC